MLVILGLHAGAAVRLPHVFSEHMVLQRDIRIPVWGWDEPGQKVAVKLGENEAAAVAGTDGKWRVSLPAMKAGGPHVMSVAGSSTVNFANVMTGDVWVASGQSNMAMTVARTRIITYGGINQAREEIARAGYNGIRLFNVPQKGTLEPQDDCTTSWVVCSPQTVSDFSAVGYLFGRDIHTELKIPIGIISSATSGSTAEQWTRRETLRANPDVTPQPIENKDECSGFYNGMIAPIVPYAIKGVIWYQCEGNTIRAHKYKALFSLLIRDWRDAWGQGEPLTSADIKANAHAVSGRDFPFIFVQLSSIGRPEGIPFSWAELRESQLKTWQEVPNTGMAVTIDTGDGSPHPRNKQDVAKRLSLAARALVYGEKIVYSGPIYREMKVEGAAIRVSFDHCGGGLVAAGGELRQFVIAGEDHKFVPAVAKLDGNSVVVSSPEIPKSVAVRYAWTVNPVNANLRNSEGLPASPFRTDSLPYMTAQAAAK